MSSLFRERGYIFLRVCSIILAVQEVFIVLFKERVGCCGG